MGPLQHLQFLLDAVRGVINSDKSGLTDQERDKLIKKYNHFLDKYEAFRTQILALERKIKTLQDSKMHSTNLQVAVTKQGALPEKEKLKSLEKELEGICLQAEKSFLNEPSQISQKIQTERFKGLQRYEEKLAASIANLLTHRDKDTSALIDHLKETGKRTNLIISEFREIERGNAPNKAELMHAELAKYEISLAVLKNQIDVMPPKNRTTSNSQVFVSDVAQPPSGSLTVKKNSGALDTKPSEKNELNSNNKSEATIPSQRNNLQKAQNELLGNPNLTSNSPPSNDKEPTEKPG